MSFEQKYLKYKQKYQELKRQLGGSVHQLETDNTNEGLDYILTDTPTFENIINKRQNGGNSYDTEVLDYTLTDTPQFSNMDGGSILAPAPFVTPAPLTSCAGSVNPMPNVAVAGATAVLPNLTSITTPPVVTANKNYSQEQMEELNSTTDLSEINNTEDIEKLFKQYGAGRGRKNSGSSKRTESSARTTSERTSHRKSKKSHRNSSSSSSVSSSDSVSDSDDSLSQLDDSDEF